MSIFSQEKTSYLYLWYAIVFNFVMVSLMQSVLTAIRCITLVEM